MKKQLGLIFLLAGVAMAQPQPAQPPVQGAPPAMPVPATNVPLRVYSRVADGQEATPPPPAARPPMERSLMPGPPGRWWNNPQAVQRLALNSDQQKKMDDIFQQNRLKLIDLNATLQKEEVTLEPLVSADQPDEPKILAQIDKVVQARAELEKANARFLLGIRRVLTPDQWKKLRGENPPDGGGMAPRPAEPVQPPALKRQ